MRTALILTGLLVASGTHAQTSAASGEDLFERYCASCHEVTASNGQGPSLERVVGRQVASVAGFAYSPALRAVGAKGLRWDAAHLDRFLSDPSKLYPGTTMPQSVSKPENRKAIIAYLKAQ
ncbi:cytochrome c family protein [Asticcacaulis sp. AND118]|uniref:c-type cytochrome n=1 Tax=Asticcacaulis sp. AND118 TaxID=2840468 RepID=UPI001CFF72C2|nr:c-type cytochrome [Asticcacaulis sp. AND118]UDF04164.1 c-type cytochrome [Asticcacaulis sp. AND118]